MKTRNSFLVSLAIICLILTLACNQDKETKTAKGASEKSDGLFRTIQDSKHGYTNKTGQIIISPQFNHASPFSEGVATVAMGEKIGYIDKSGKYIWTPTK